MWGVAFPEPYMKLYNASALALKAVNTSLKVGGPATEQTLYVADFIAAAEAQKLPVETRAVWPFACFVEHDQRFH